MTFWHRVQRLWPFIRVERPLKEVPGVIWIIADAPDISGDKYGVKVELDGVKQGSYNSQPACFLKFTVENGIINEASETCYDFRLCSASNDSTAQTSPTPSRAFIAAYGPAHVTDTELPVAANPKQDGLVLVVWRSSVGRHTVAHSFFFAMVVVHTQDVVLKVIPSISDRRRARVLQRSRIRPVLLDSAGEAENHDRTCNV